MEINRRSLLTRGAAMGALGSALSYPARSAARERLDVGLIGVGMRGQVHLQELLRREDVNVVALCDIEPIMLERCKAIVDKAGKPQPRLYGANGDKQAYLELLQLKGLDAVVIATPWEGHGQQSIDAMEAKVAVGCEVVAGITLEDHWKVLRVQQKTGTPYMLLENVCYRRDVMAMLQVARAGLFGEVVHLQGGYQHDLRGVKLNSGDPSQPYNSGVEFGEKGWSEARWRTEHSVHRNGELYPSHGIGPCAMVVNIHRGNRFTHLSSFASKATGLHEYIVKHPKGGENHPSAKVKFKLGDVVTTMIGCANGETILLTHDTSLPRPYSLGFRIQGSRGLWMDLNKSVHIEGLSKPHAWEDAKAYLEKFDHPLWKRMGPQAAESGHGGMDYFVIHAFVEALKAGEPMPIDIYDAVAWSAITPLSEQSIAERRTVEFPDFSEGHWRSRKPIFAFGDKY